jgi:hypothetical protein
VIPSAPGSSHSSSAARRSAAPDCLPRLSPGRPSARRLPAGMAPGASGDLSGAISARKPLCPMGLRVICRVPGTLRGGTAEARAAPLPGALGPRGSRTRTRTKPAQSGGAGVRWSSYRFYAGEGGFEPPVPRGLTRFRVRHLSPDGLGPTASALVSASTGGTREAARAAVPLPAPLPRSDSPCSTRPETRAAVA